MTEGTGKCDSATADGGVSWLAMRGREVNGSLEGVLRARGYKCSPIRKVHESGGHGATPSSWVFGLRETGRWFGDCKMWKTEGSHTCLT